MLVVNGVRIALVTGANRGLGFEAARQNEGGALIVYEAIIDDDRSENAFGLLMSLNMLIETEGGFDYTAADCMGWMTDAGFTSARAEDDAGTARQRFTARGGR